jgi:putative transposase
MARMARVVVPFYPHHVTQRGNRRQKTFFDERDYAGYLELMSKFCRKARTQVWAYCLMPNHVHLVMVPSHVDGLRGALAETHRRYTLEVNGRKQWRGHLWQERFHSCPMDEAYLMAAVRYVERNPVVSRLCGRPQDWPWSSAVAHLQGRDDGLVQVEPMLSRVDDWAAYLSQSGREEINADISKHSRTGRPLGDEGFVLALEEITGRVLTRRSPGRKKTDEEEWANR